MMSHRDQLLVTLKGPGSLDHLRSEIAKWDTLDYAQAIDLSRMQSELQQALDQSKKKTCPFFIIRAGTTGSGKSNVFINNMVDGKVLGMSSSDRKNMIHINIDSLVEHYSDFELEVKRLLRMFPKEEVQKMISDRYFARRGILGLQNNALLWEALARGVNIDFETTLGAAEWTSHLVDHIHSSFPQYHVVLVYYFVEWSVLEKRLQKRNAVSERKVDPTFALNLARKALENLPKVGSHVDQIIIINNTPELPNPPRLIGNVSIRIRKSIGKCQKPSIGCCDPLEGVLKTNAQMSQWFQKMCESRGKCKLRI